MCVLVGVVPVLWSPVTRSTTIIKQGIWQYFAHTTTSSMGNVSFSALGRVEELGACLRCGLGVVEGQIGERLFMEQRTFICQSLLDMVLINHSYFHRRIAKIFFQCAFTLRAPLDARPFSALLKPAGNTDRNAGPVLASSSLIVKRTACNGKALPRDRFYPHNARKPVLLTTAQRERPACWVVVPSSQLVWVSLLESKKWGHGSLLA
ncbi:unnamed protein product [Trypanosoma congolense IL3000]|uniref:WGS project CAEQ00000000 data, annotated contig 1411 n=1 Tax=Trypanosoma congolense (strain IL3000) TaxID=1068625 RepID=F9W612_TRYCI|nr:unnamed protein product [Trypanosoma congolense IL3000]